VQRGHGVSPNLARIFPILMLIGGALLLTHSHAVANAKEQLLIEMTHLPIAVLGVVAGSARWLELSTPNREGRIGGLIWPTALILVGVVLLGYREG
jgi:putative copper resistance protein D